MKLAFAFASVAAFALLGCAGPSGIGPAPNYRAIVNAADRTDADRKNDERRDPVQLLAFTDVRTGMRVLDLGAGGGYSTELLARSVGPSGRVYGQNASSFPERILKNFDERLQRPAMRNVVKVVRDFDDPVPAEARDFDLITFFFVYHDTPWMGVDRARMNKAIFAALKPGGTLVIADHSGRPGTGVSESKSLHRIDESAVRREVEAAGFRFVGDANFLRNPQDQRDTLVFKSPVRVDEFILKFVKP